MGSFDASDTFAQKTVKINTAHLQKIQHCFTHNDTCELFSEDKDSDVDFSGLPCPDNSRANHNRQFEEGKTGPVYIVWAKKHKAKKTPLLILENPPVAR